MEYYKVSEVAEIFSVTKQAVNLWIKKGKLKAYKIADSTVRIRKEDVEKIKREM